MQPVRFLEACAVLWDLLQEHGYPAWAPPWAWPPQETLQDSVVQDWLYAAAVNLALREVGALHEVALLAIRAPDAPPHTPVVGAHSGGYHLRLPHQTPDSCRLAQPIPLVQRWVGDSQLRSEAVRLARYEGKVERLERETFHESWSSYLEFRPRATDAYVAACRAHDENAVYEPPEGDLCDPAETLQDGIVIRIRRFQQTSFCEVSVERTLTRVSDPRDYVQIRALFLRAVRAALEVLSYPTLLRGGSS